MIFYRFDEVDVIYQTSEGGCFVESEVNGVEHVSDCLDWVVVSDMNEDVEFPCLRVESTEDSVACDVFVCVGVVA